MRCAVAATASGSPLVRQPRASASGGSAYQIRAACTWIAGVGALEVWRAGVRAGDGEIGGVAATGQGHAIGLREARERGAVAGVGIRLREVGLLGRGGVARVRLDARPERALAICPELWNRD